MITYNDTVPLVLNRLIFFVDTQLKAVVSDGQLLLNYLHSRHVPAEHNEIMEKKQQHRIELEKKRM